MRRKSKVHFERHALKLCRMLSTGRYSDLTINCKGKVFHVHRNIVCLQSKSLAACVDGAWLEGINGEIKLVDDEPEIVDRMIKFMYEEDYCDGSNTTEDGDQGAAKPLVLSTKLYIIADKYDVPALKELAKRKYETAVSHRWDLTSFITSLELMYNHTPESDRLLKDVAIRAGTDHLIKLVNRSEFACLCKKNGEVGLDLLRLL